MTRTAEHTPAQHAPRSDRHPRFIELDRLIALDPETGARFKPAAPRLTASQRRAEYLRATGRAA